MSDRIDDPEKTFAEAAGHILYQANNYSEWLSAAGLQPLAAHLGDREQLRQSGLLKVVDPRQRDRHGPELYQDWPRGGRKRIWSYSPRR